MTQPHISSFISYPVETDPQVMLAFAMVVPHRIGSRGLQLLLGQKNEARWQIRPTGCLTLAPEAEGDAADA